MPQLDAETVVERSQFWHLMHDRRSIRRYENRSIDPAILTHLLEAARWAPSAHNRQPWRFCVVTSDETKIRLSREMGERWRHELAADGVDVVIIERQAAISHTRITGAAAVVIACMSLADMDNYPDAKRQRAEETMAIQSVALACQNLLLAAYQHGLGACWMCAPLFVPDIVRTALSLPSHWEPQAMITLGYPAEEKVKDRQPLESRVLWR